VPLHLCAKHEFRLGRGDLRFDIQIVVGNQRLDAVGRRRLAHIARMLAAIGAETHQGETEFADRDPGGRNGMGRVTENEDLLARQVVGIDRARVPGQVAVPFALGHGKAREQR
jgi:hypothetical protein